MTHQYVGPALSGLLEQGVQFSGHLALPMWTGCWTAQSASGAIVSAGSGETSDIGLHELPRGTIQTEPGFENDDWGATADTPQVEANGAEVKRVIEEAWR